MNYKIAIYTFAYGSKATIQAEITNPFKQKYAELHGYDYIYISPETLSDTDPKWEKLTYAIKLLPNYDYLVWIDADAAPVNLEVTIESLIVPKKDFLIARDPHELNGKEWYFNTGFFILKNSAWTMQFLKYWQYKSQFHNRNQTLQDQPVANNIYWHNWNNIKKHTHLYGKFEVQPTHAKYYKPGMFIKHCAASKDPDNFHNVFFENLDKDYLKKHGLITTPHVKQPIALRNKLQLLPGA